jgi:2-polyprenyl-6-methoxyphenol hydroxylase-like FAD-dependent oxidoreductase
MKKNITIVGGGIAGLTTAIALNKAGFFTTIFEAAPEVKAVGAGLALAANAMKAFQKIGIAEDVIAEGRILPAFLLLDQQGKQLAKTNSEVLSKKYGVDNFIIHRADLHRVLLSKLDPTTVHSNKRIVDIVTQGEKTILTFQDGSTHETEVLVAADGIHSPIRKKLLPKSKERYAGYTCWRAIIDNTKLQITESSETWGSKGRFGIVPLAHNKIYWFACINAKAQDEKMKAFRVADLLEHFKDFHAPIPQILQETKDEHLLWNDINDLQPIHQLAFGNIVLIGDAGHATTPNMGQGACQAIEDAIVLADELSKTNDVVAAFKAFENRRIQRVHRIVNTSWTFGKIAHIENPWLISARNFLFRHIPASINEKQVQVVYEVDF